jgi:hypothetical protein
VPRCRECTYVPDLDEWACAVCSDRLDPMVALRALIRLRMGASLEVDPEGDDLEDADFDADELGLETEPD